MTTNQELTPFSPDHGSRRQRNWLIILICAVLPLALYLIPHAPAEAMQTHKAIVDALRAGNNWGRQALVGNVDYPVLQSLALLITDVIAGWLHLDGPRLLCAIAQAWFLSYFFRAALERKGWFAAPFALALAVILPFIRKSMLTLDPNWVAAVPAAAIFYHLLSWKSNGGLRDIILAGANCGLLVLCGIGPAIFGAATVILIYCQVKAEYAKTSKSSKGMRTLLWSTYAYCALLWFLWNWLVMDDPFFGLKDLLKRADSTLPKNIFEQARYYRNVIITSFALISPLAIAAVKSDMAPVAKSIILQPITIAFAICLSSALGVPMTALAPLLCSLLIATFTMLLLANFHHNVPRTSGTIAAIICACLSFMAPSIAAPASDTRIASAPERQELTDYIDQFWPDSRTMLYGLRLPAIYPDTSEKRFVARLDYQENDFLEQAKNEQLHILVPPPDGVFYPRKAHPLAEIHANGKPWLLLEKQWRDGWQLWRAVIPPDKESRLDFMR